MRIDSAAGRFIADASLEKSNSSRSAAGQSQASFPEEQEMSVRKLGTRVLEEPEVRLDKVESLRSAMANGTYRVSAEQVAGSLLEQLRRRT
jgi:flagellar biosynthesis anti-sigma factor FlgM